MRSYNILLLGSVQMDKLPKEQSRSFSFTSYHKDMHLSNGDRVRVNMHVYDDEMMKPEVKVDGVISITSSDTDVKRYVEWILKTFMDIPYSVCSPSNFDAHLEDVISSLYKEDIYHEYTPDKENLVSQIRQKLLEIEYLLTTNK